MEHSSLAHCKPRPGSVWPHNLPLSVHMCSSNKPSCMLFWYYTILLILLFLTDKLKVTCLDLMLLLLYSYGQQQKKLIKTLQMKTEGFISGCIFLRCWKGVFFNSLDSDANTGPYSGPLRTETSQVPLFTFLSRFSRWIQSPFSVSIVLLFLLYNTFYE